MRLLGVGTMMQVRVIQKKHGYINVYKYVYRTVISHERYFSAYNGSSDF